MSGGKLWRIREKQRIRDEMDRIHRQYPHRRQLTIGQREMLAHLRDKLFRLRRLDDEELHTPAD